MKFHQLMTPCDLSRTPIEEAIILMDEMNGLIRRRYTLFVHQSQEVWAKNLLRVIGAEQKENPLAPYINLFTDHELKRGDWYLQGMDLNNPLNILKIGSKGIL